MKANYKDQKREGNIFPRGTFTTTFKELESETGLTNSEIRTAIKNLKKSEEINVDKTTSYTIIRVNNYEVYQDPLANEQRTNNEQTSNDQRTNIVSSNKDNKDNKEIKQQQGGRKRSKPKIDPDHKQAADSQSAEADVRWFELLKIWNTNEDPNILNGPTRKKYWNVLGTDQQLEYLQFVQSLGQDAVHLSNIWISTFFKDGGSTLYLQHLIDGKKNQKPKSKESSPTHNFGKTEDYLNKLK
jgi:hypothetical protein